MTNISTTIQRRKTDIGQEIVATRPGVDGTITLVPAVRDEMVPVADVEKAIRMAYAFGREDSQRQTAAIMRGLLAT